MKSTKIILEKKRKKKKIRKVEKKKSNFEKKKLKKNWKKNEKKKWGRITVDYCCNSNPQWNVCGGTVKKIWKI